MESSQRSWRHMASLGSKETMLMSTGVIVAFKVQNSSLLRKWIVDAKICQQNLLVRWPKFASRSRPLHDKLNTYNVYMHVRTMCTSSRWFHLTYMHLSGTQRTHQRNRQHSESTIMSKEKTHFIPTNTTDSIHKSTFYVIGVVEKTHSERRRAYFSLPSYAN